MQEACNLTQARSGQQAFADAVKKFGTTQPVAGLKGLLAEGAAAM
jgi:hypothetical protein